MVPIQKNSATAALRRIPILIYSDTDGVTPWAGSVTGVKAQLAFRFGTEAASSADIVRVGGAEHYVELTQAESNTSTGPVTARVAAAAGRLEGVGLGVIIADDPYAVAATTTEMADALLTRDLSAVTEGSGRTPIQAFRALRNRVAVAGGTATIYKEDDTTSSWTGVVTGTPAVTEVNPA